MPRFHFNIHDGRDDIDKVGTELFDVQDARIEALRLAGEIIRDAATRGDFGEEWGVEVTDEAGLPLFRMDFKVVDARAAMVPKPPR